MPKHSEGSKSRRLWAPDFPLSPRRFRPFYGWYILAISTIFLFFWLERSCSRLKASCSSSPARFIRMPLARFLLANLNGFDPKTDMVKAEDMVALDRWVVSHTSTLQKEIIETFK